MLKKFMFLTTHGLKKKLKSKAFIIVNILLLVLLVGIFNIDNIISFFGGKFDEQITLYVKDNTNNNVYNTFEDMYKSTSNSLDDDGGKLKIEKTTKDVEKLKEELKGNSNIILIFNDDKENFLNAELLSEDYIDTITYQILVQTINSTKYNIALKTSNIDPSELAKIQKSVTVTRTILDEGKSSEDENMNIVMSVVFPTVILPFFMLVIILVQMIGGEINEEKSSRGMEIIISNVSAKAHFFSKMLSANLFVILQAVLVFLYGVIGMFTRNMATTGINSSITSEISKVIDSLAQSGFIDKLIYIIPLTLILMILSFITYSLVAGILASMTVSIEDYQQIQMPIIIVCLIGYYLSIMASMFDGSIFIKILSYVPFISCLLAPALLVIGQIGIIDVIISIIILIIFNFILIKYGLRIYKIGILNYSTDKMWSRIFKAVKTR